RVGVPHVGDSLPMNHTDDVAAPIMAHPPAFPGWLLVLTGLILLVSSACASSAHQDTTPTAAPPTETVAPTARHPAGDYGFGYGMQLESGTDYPRALKLLQDAGFGWAKVQVRWEQVEPRPGDIVWDHWDRVVAQSEAAGIKLLFSVVTAPAWARPKDADLSSPGPPQDPATYATFIGQLAQRYAGRVQAYEIWNEQNLAREWGGPGRLDAAQYVALLRRAHAAVKAADPAAVVVLGALTPAGTADQGQGAIAIDDVEYFEQMYRAGAKGYFDAVGAHPSGFNNAPDLDPLDPANATRPGGWRDHRSFYFRNFERYREIMVRQGDSDQRIWFTEFGWASSPTPAPEYAYAAQISAQDQARYLVQAIEIARERGYIGPVFVWNLNFAPSTEAADREGKRAFSILNSDWSPRPAYRALAAMPK
ncbi:MAG: hypothetical protein HY689_00480, partial [Chloroflexi bacterium]|nr:hypothetical protein [Chloroflexota bacterium]